MSNIKDHLSIVGQAVIELVPYIGGSINTLISEYQAKRKNERLLDFYSSLKNDFEKFKKNLNSEFTSTADFLDVFEETAIKIVNERSSDKRIAFKNILINSCLANVIDYDYAEENLRLLARLRSEHLFFLRLFNHPRSFNFERGNVLGEGGGLSTSLSRLLRVIIPEHSDEKILDICNDLENERLLSNVVNSYNAIVTDKGINHLENKLSAKGKRFYSFIIEPSELSV